MLLLNSKDLKSDVISTSDSIWREPGNVGCHYMQKYLGVITVQQSPGCPIAHPQQHPIYREVGRPWPLWFSEIFLRPVPDRNYLY